MPKKLSSKERQRRMSEGMLRYWRQRRARGRKNIVDNVERNNELLRRLKVLNSSLSLGD